MKASAELKRREVSTTVATAPLPGEDFNYHPLALGKAPRRRLQAVAPLERMPREYDSPGVDDMDLVMTGRGSHGMLSQVATSMLIRPAFKKTKMRVVPPMLTTEEFIQVRLATVRESTRHCYWPADVVATFAAADVIR